MDDRNHLTRPHLLSFFETTASLEEKRQVLNHLLTEWEKCRELAEKVWLETGGSGWPAGQKTRGSA